MHRARDARRRIDSFSSFVIPAQAGTQKRQALPYAALGPGLRRGDGEITPPVAHAGYAAHQIFRAARLPPHAARFLQACHALSVGRLFSIVEPTHAMRGSETPPPPPKPAKCQLRFLQAIYRNLSEKLQSGRLTRCQLCQFRSGVQAVCVTSPAGRAGCAATHGGQTDRPPARGGSPTG